MKRDRTDEKDRKKMACRASLNTIKKEKGGSNRQNKKLLRVDCETADADTRRCSCEKKLICFVCMRS